VLQQTALDGSFTYQGRLAENNQPANGTYDLRFTIYGAETGSAQICTVAAEDTVERADVTVTNGLFTVPLDFCAEAFDGDKRWLEIAVRPGSSTGTYTVLSPRQPISPTPYALYAQRSGGLQVPFSATGATTGTNAVFAITQNGTTTPGVALFADGGGGTGADINGDTIGLDLDGPLKVSGTKTAFQVTVVTGTGENVCNPGPSTNARGVEIPLTVANAATDMVFVTVVGGTPLAGGFGVTFDDAACVDNSWVIYSIEDTALPNGLIFNVLVIKQ
jgi:hypothetical protein